MQPNDAPEPAAPTLAAGDVRRLETHHAALLELCLQLEATVEELDSSTVRSDLTKLAETIPPLLSETHTLEEGVLFPDFDRHAGSCFSAMMIQQLKAEHRSDRLAAQELSMTLKAFAEGRCSLALDTISYMIRGFMECVRRHISSERLMLEALLAAESEGREVLA